MTEPKTRSPSLFRRAGTSLDPRAAPRTTPKSERAPARKPVRIPRHTRKKTNNKIRRSSAFTPLILQSENAFYRSVCIIFLISEEEKKVEG
jgi:hypothetical protein